MSLVTMAAVPGGGIARFGFRGLVLIILGTMHIDLGLVALVDPNRTPGLFHTQLPGIVRFSIWVLPGVFAITSVVLGRTLWLAWFLLAIGPVQRCGSWTWALTHDPRPVEVLWAVFYAAISSLIFVLARWPEAPLWGSGDGGS